MYVHYKNAHMHTRTNKHTYGKNCFVQKQKQKTKEDKDKAQGLLEKMFIIL